MPLKAVALELPQNSVCISPEVNLTNDFMVGSCCGSVSS